MSAARRHPPDRSVAGRYWPEGGVDSDAFRARFPDRELLIEMARQASQGRIRFWHPWHMERTPVPERIGRKIVWSAAPNGDREWPHALARCSHLVDLAAGHAITGSSDLLAAWIDHVSQLVRSRDRGLKSKWAGLVRPYERELWDNRLDAALRLVNLIRSYDLLRERSALPPSLHSEVLGLMVDDAERLAAGLGSRVGNWEVFISSAVLLASTYLHRIEAARGWGERARARLGVVLGQEIGPDGIMAEQVPMYQGVCVLALADLLVAFRPNGLAPPPELVLAVRSMLDALERITDPSGRIPQIGDSDAFEPAYLEEFATAALGSEVLHRGPTDRSPGEERAASVDALPSAGWGIARWRERGGGTGYLLLDASGRPAATHAGHSHADDLQFIFHAGDGPLLVDPGRFTYANGFQPHLPFVGRALTPRGRFGALNTLLFPRFRQLNERDWRAHFRSTLAHNTVAIGGRNRPGYEGAVGEPAAVHLFAAGVDRDVFSLAGSSEGDGGASGRFRHDRTVVGVVPEILVVVDRLESEAAADWIASIHVAIGVIAQMPSGDAVLLQRPGGAERRIVFASFDGRPVELTLEDDWISPIYNEKHRAHTVRASIRGASEACLISALSLGGGSPAPKIERLPEGTLGSAAVRVSLASPGGQIEVLIDSVSRVLVRRRWPEGEVVTAVEPEPRRLRPS